MSFDNLLKRIPELKSIMQAIEEHASNKPITSRCIHCNELLVYRSNRFPETGRIDTWINCPNGCTADHTIGEISDSDEL